MRQKKVILRKFRNNVTNCKDFSKSPKVFQKNAVNITIKYQKSLPSNVTQCILCYIRRFSGRHRAISLLQKTYSQVTSNSYTRVTPEYKH